MATYNYALGNTMQKVATGSAETSSERDMFVTEYYLRARGILPATSATSSSAASTAPASSAGTSSGTASAGTAVAAPTIDETPYLTLALNRVNPGDLITSACINDVCDAIIALHRRLLDIETGLLNYTTAAPAPAPAPAPATAAPAPAPAAISTKPDITSAVFWLPSSGVAAVRVLGKNLTTIQRIEIGGAEVQARKIITGATELAFSFPFEGEVAELQKQDIAVYGREGSDSSALRLASQKQMIDFGKRLDANLR